MFRLIKYFKWYYWLLILLLMVLVFAHVTFDLKLPELMQDIVRVSNTNGTQGQILEIGLKMILFSFSSFAMMILLSFLSSILAAGFARILRKRVYEKVDSFSAEDMNAFSTSSLITRTTNDIQQIQTVMTMFLRMAFVAPFMAGVAITKILGYSQKISIVVAIGVFAIIIMITLIFIYAIPKFKRIQKYIDKMNLVTRENLTGLRVVRAYNAEDYQEEKFGKVNDDLTKTHLVVNRAMSLMDPAMQLTFNGTVLGIFWVGAYLIFNHQLGNNQVEGIAQLMAFSTYGSLIVMSFTMLTFLFILIPRANISARRIREVLNTKNKILNPREGKSPKETGTIEFKNVSFKYPEAQGYVLENISFRVNQGETVAFIGSTGSGKSTVINLIPRFFDVTEGEILVDGINVKEYNQEDLFKLIGIVPQKGVLFSGTIESNLKIGNPNASEEEMWEAIRISQAEEFVSKLEEKLQHPIAQGGKNVSGGQKQRLCIARAIIKKPEIYIFDDSFSALDNQTDRKLRKELFNETKGSTNLIVATRIGTIINADKIIVLEQGKLIGIGTHKELLKSSEVYREIAYSQLSKEELENE